MKNTKDIQFPTADLAVLGVLLIRYATALVNGLFLFICGRVKPAVFDLFLALGIASYLGLFYLALVVS